MRIKAESPAAVNKLSCFVMLLTVWFKNNLTGSFFSRPFISFATTERLEIKAETTPTGINKLFFFCF